MSKLAFKLKGSKNRKDDTRFHIVVVPGLKLNLCKKYKDIHKNIFSAIAVAQFFGLLPIVGIFSKNINDMKFKLISFRTLHTSLWFLSAMIFLYLELVRMANDKNLNAKSFGKNFDFFWTS